MSLRSCLRQQGVIFFYHHHPALASLRAGLFSVAPSALKSKKSRTGKRLLHWPAHAMKTKNNFCQHRKAIIFRCVDVQGFRRIRSFGPSKARAEVATPHLGIATLGSALVVQVHPCKQALEPLVFTKIVIPGIHFDVRERRGVLLISLLQKRQDFFPLG